MNKAQVRKAKVSEKTLITEPQAALQGLDHGSAPSSELFNKA